MSLIPAFEIGIWNTWILALALIFFHVILKGRVPQETAGRSNVLINAILCLLFIYSVFLPLPLGSAWFYIGLVIFLLGVVLLRIAGAAWATTLPNEPVTKGPYRYSRHPFYFAMLMQLIGMSIASASWVFLFSSIVLIILTDILVGTEEASCVETYGDAYRKYMDRTPRWIGLPKLKS
jgi:protein-S-isoprenylcysteine O-methyltransferase Ste14